MGPLSFVLGWGLLDGVTEWARPGNCKEMTGLERAVGVLQNRRLLILPLENPPYTLSSCSVLSDCPLFLFPFQALSLTGLTFCLPESPCTFLAAPRPQQPKLGSPSSQQAQGSTPQGPPALFS